MNKERKSISLFACLFLIGGVLNSQPQEKDLKLWFTRPALEWNEALPVGNGRLGAMIFGGIERERIQLNEETVWAGKKMDYHNPKSKEGLKEVRQLLFDGKHEEAEKVAMEKIMGQLPRDFAQTYQTLGDLMLDFGDLGNISNYRRVLDIEQAIANVSYSAKGVRYTREIFSSHPDQLLALRISADREGALNFTARLSRPGNKADIKADSCEILMTEHVGNGIGVKMATRVLFLPENGSISSSGDSVRIEGANTVTILLTAATDYRGNDPEAMSKAQLKAAAGKAYDEIKNAHVADYQKYFNRLDLDLGTSDGVFFATDARLEAVKNGYIDPQLIELYYQFGRYLLIGSSRPGSLPANLQGIWADGLYPPWSADYHININIQMNYWPAEAANLSEMHLPFLEFINALRPDARKTAKEVYGMKGITAHYTTDVWHYTEPTGQIGYGMWPMGIAWSCQHFWEHYLFTGDIDFLQELGYPAMKEAAEFCVDWLINDPRTGKLVSGPSISPENKFITPDGRKASMTIGPAMDQMIVFDLLSNTIAASKTLDKDAIFRKKLEKTLTNLYPVQIGQDGRLMEWMEEYEEADPGHRHISHLYGLHPGKQISEQRNPELMDAARKTIEYRLSHGGGHTGWSRAWIINFYARLLDGEKAYENLLALLRQSTLSNLFDTHPPFQIDGNFGAVAGIMEMLLQSHTGELHLLPALPSDWQKGYVHGICARGGFELDLNWENGRLKKATVYSKLGNKCMIRYGGKTISFNTEKGESYSFGQDLKEL